MTEPDTLRCARHPNVETNLRCGKCGTPICPRCMVQTPVGARCRDCARIVKLPTYRVSAVHYLKAAGTGIGAGALGGIVWGLINILLMEILFLRSSNILFGVISIGLAAGFGWLIGEAISRAVNRKRGPWLAVTGAVALLLCFCVMLGVELVNTGYLSVYYTRIIIAVIAIGAGMYTAVQRLR